MITEWRVKPIEGNPDYFICDDGTCYSFKRNKARTLNPKRSWGGYLRMRRCSNAKESYLWIQILVASHFIGDTSGLEVHHKDRDRRNNHWTNLEIITKRENLNKRNEANGWAEHSKPLKSAPF